MFEKKKALKNEISKLKSELRKTQHQLTETKGKLSTIRTFERRYLNKCTELEREISDLKNEITELKKENRRLELAEKAVKSVQIAHQNYNRKEA